MKKTDVIVMLNIIKNSVNVMTERKLIRLIEKFIEKIEEY